MASTHRRYTNITVDEFEQFLEGIVQFSRVRDTNAAEAVYSIDLPHDKLEVRIFSTINPDGNARNCGNDAIRNVIWSTEDDVPVSGRKKTLRIAPTDSNPEGWKGNLRPKIEDMMLNWREAINPRCDECGSWMARRESEHGPFWGCLDYPNCTHTVNIDE